MHCVDLGESFPTHIFLQTLASIQPRTRPVKFACSPRLQIPQVLLNMHADHGAEAVQGSRRGVIFYAARHGHAEIIDFLLDRNHSVGSAVFTTLRCIGMYIWYRCME